MVCPFRHGRFYWRSVPACQNAFRSFAGGWFYWRMNSITSLFLIRMADPIRRQGNSCPVSACKPCFCIPRAVQRSAERSVHPGNPKLCLCDNWFFRLNVYSQGLIHRQSSFGVCSLQPPFDAHWDTMEDVCKNERNAWCCAIDYGITIALWNCK